jgi:hypothetical protein
MLLAQKNPNANVAIGVATAPFRIVAFPDPVSWVAKMPLKAHAGQPVEKGGSVLMQTA